MSISPSPDALAILSDVHGNYRGFQQVLRHLEGLDLRQPPVICGDLLWHSYEDYEALAVLDLVMSRPDWRIVAGNTDRWLHDGFLEDWSPTSGRGVESRRRQLELKRTMSDEQLEFLRRLPDHLKLVYAGRSVCVTHASPRSRDDGLEPALSGAEFRHRLDGRREDVLITGHLHRSFVHAWGSRLHCSVGAIGKHPEEYDGVVEFAFLDATEQGVVFIPAKLLQDCHPTPLGETRPLVPWKRETEENLT